MPVPIPAVNVELGIGDTIRAIGEIQNRAREDLRRQQDKALTELRQQLDITLTVIFKLENLFIEILRGYRNPEITGNREALQEHLNQTRMLLESRNLLPYLDHARGAIEAAASSSRFKSADYREMVEGLQELAGKLYSWRMALGPGGITGPGVWRLRELCSLAEQQLAAAPQPPDPEIAMAAKEAFELYDWQLSTDIRRLIAHVKITDLCGGC
jgi:hypothetical protein